MQRFCRRWGTTVPWMAPQKLYPMKARSGPIDDPELCLVVEPDFGRRQVTHRDEGLAERLRAVWREEALEAHVEDEARLVGLVLFGAVHQRGREEQRFAILELDGLDVGANLLQELDR